METNRVKERAFYMSCFDRFTKLKRNDEIEVSVPLISFAIWQIFVWPSHAVRTNTLLIRIKPFDWQLPILLRE